MSALDFFFVHILVTIDSLRKKFSAFHTRACFLAEELTFKLCSIRSAQNELLLAPFSSFHALFIASIIKVTDYFVAFFV